jgi:Pyruvate/2-oxoacid:ferredoxin oxidoreductase delta subunit
LNYFIARPVLEADLVINLPKLKTHALTLYTGAVKNLFGVIPGKRKSEVHIRAPGVQDFSRELVNLLELVRPALTLMDGVGGMEGEGPGAGGTPHAYGCLAASTDPVALDSVLSQAMGFRNGAVVHLAQAGKRGLGTSDRAHIQVIGAESVLDFGRRMLPPERWYMRAPSWVTAPAQSWVKLEPKFKAAGCSGCAKCVQICPGKALQNGSPAGAGNPPRLNKKMCIGCMCCAEVCPQGVIEARRSPLARLIGLGG